MLWFFKSVKIKFKLFKITTPWLDSKPWPWSHVTQLFIFTRIFPHFPHIFLPKSVSLKIQAFTGESPEMSGSLSVNSFFLTPHFYPDFRTYLPTILPPFCRLSCREFVNTYNSVVSSGIFFGKFSSFWFEHEMRVPKHSHSFGHFDGLDGLLSADAPVHKINKGINIIMYPY